MQSSSQIITTNEPTSSFLQARCPSCRPTNCVKALKFHVCKYKIYSKSVPRSRAIFPHFYPPSPMISTSWHDLMYSLFFCSHYVLLVSQQQQRPHCTRSFLYVIVLGSHWSLTNCLSILNHLLSHIFHWVHTTIMAGIMGINWVWGSL